MHSVHAESSGAALNINFVMWLAGLLAKAWLMVATLASVAAG